MKNIKDDVSKMGDIIRTTLWNNIYRNIKTNNSSDIRIKAWVDIYRNISDNIQDNIYESIKSNLYK